MAETFLPFTINHIESQINQGSNFPESLKSEVRALVTELTNISSLLAVGERQSLSHEARRLIADLRRIAYEAEDVVDTAVAEYLALSTILRFGYVGPKKELRNLNERTRVVRSLIDQHLKGSSYSSSRFSSGRMSPARGAQSPKGHLPAMGDYDLVIGIDHEITRLVELLTKKESDDGPKAVAIVGMGGSGKTTLARCLYNHKVVKNHFQFQAWVSATQGWNTSRMLYDILSQIRGQKSWFPWFSKQPLNDEELANNNDSNGLLSQLYNLLNKENCLLVVDDVLDLRSLHEFIALIQGDVSNSQTITIIITSRQIPSSNNIDWSIHQPQPLNDEEGLDLFSRAASNSSTPLSADACSLAMTMLKRCQGLPLAIVALARLQKSKGNMREWRGVLSTSMYSPVNKILGLSYEQLPYYLKPCFLYLGLFSEGAAISGGTLIRMWIAEGFIESNVEETLEVAAARYLQELIYHSMVQVVMKTHSGKVKTIQIHNIMRDFCVSRATELEFLTVTGSTPEANRKKSRRGAINARETHVTQPYSATLRTLVLFGKSSATRSVTERYPDQANHVSTNLSSVCQIYKLLRVLDIFGVNSVDGTVPTEIGNLINLTYLRIRSTNIRQLPKTIGKLCNLLTLDYWDVHTNIEVQVPNVLSKLKRLRHLYLPKEMSGSVEALRLHRLKDLVTLWGVSGGHWMLKEMGRMSCTSLNKLYVHKISDDSQLKAILGCSVVKENNNLYALALEWFGFETESLDSLASNCSLRKLKLIGKAPDNLCSDGRQFPSNLVKLELYHTKLQKQETMARLGRLIHLKVLVLSADSYKGQKWICRDDEFPILEELKLTNLQKLEEWGIDEGSFQCLKKLSIISCRMLRRIPEGLVHVRCLEMLHVEKMPSSFVTKLQKVKQYDNTTIEGEDFHIVQDVPEVLIRDSWAS